MSITFEAEWGKYQERGYQYGEDALENVRFGFKIAADAYSTKLIEAQMRINELERAQFVMKDGS